MKKAFLEIKDNTLDHMVEVAIHAGKIILDIYNDFDVSTVEKKADKSPLTLADKSANTYIIAGLMQWQSDIPIISEEERQVPYDVRKDYELYYVVDPLDGTKEFIKKNGEFTVNIALCRGNTPIMGVVHAPVLDKTYFAEKGKGAFLIENGQRRPIKCKKVAEGTPGQRIVVSRSHMNQETKDFVARFDQPELVAIGSSLKLVLVAEGKAEIYPRLGPTMEWDTAAADIVVREAGGKVVDAVLDQPLKYNKENLLNPYFIVKAK